MIINDIRDDRGTAVGGFHSALFDCDMQAMLIGADIEYAEKCADYFNNMSEDMIDGLKKYTLRYCEDFRRFFDEESPDVPENVTADEIFSYVSPQVLIITAPKKPDKIAFSVEFTCRWEREHGMEWVIRDGKILYVGDFQSVSPWYKTYVYEKNPMNYVFREHCMD